VARAVFGEQAGADAVAMINNAASFPPFEGPILSNPDTGEEFTVTIPFLGVFGPTNSADANALRAADTATTTATTLANPGFTGFASFSSGGPRTGDSALKPDIAAPGVSIISTASGTGNKGYVLSGTSMASPHVAGVAALVRQAHPDWTTEEVKAAIVNSGDPGAVAGYRTTRAGSGLVNPAAAIGNDVVALGSKVKPDGSLDLEGFHNANLSFGFAELGKDFKDTQAITIRNHGTTTVTLALGWNASPFSAAGNVSFNKASVTIKPGKEAKVQVTLRVAASAIPSSASPTSQHAFHEVSGNVTLSGSGMVLRVPYLLVPRSLSDIETKAQGLDGDNTEATATVTNKKGAITGSADFYTWGLEDRNDVNENVLGGGGYDVRAVGVQAFPFGTTQLLVFAINNYDRWSNASVNEFDININNDADPAAEFTVVALDSGAVRAGSFNGLLEVFYVDNATGGLFASGFLASSPTDSSTLLLPIQASSLGLTPADGNFSYDAVSFSLEGAGVDVVDGVATYNPFDKALEDGQFVNVARGASVAVPIAIDPVAFNQQDPLGIMVVGIDDASGKPEADLVKARR
jgi:minor extracellular serine protease Vpr